MLYSIQWLMRANRDMFRDDLPTLFQLLHEQKIKSIVARRFPLAEARQAHELLAEAASPASSCS
jgi:NADPH2:quinone reductase